MQTSLRKSLIVSGLALGVAGGGRWIVNGTVLR